VQTRDPSSNPISNSPVLFFFSRRGWQPSTLCRPLLVLWISLPLFQPAIKRREVANYLLAIISVTDTGCLSRIPDPNFSVLTQKIGSKLSEILSGMFFPNPDPDLDFLPIPDPGSATLR
jgi:hypothetical protein